MIAYIVGFVVSAVAFLGADFVWLSQVGPRLYRPTIGPLLSDTLNGPAAVAFYIIYLLGVLILAIAPALKGTSWRIAAVNGLVLGLVAYGTYDLTNQATLKLWATSLTLADMGWGGGLTAVAATLGYLAARRFA